MLQSYSKKISGTTWTQEMVWCIMNDLDFDVAKEKSLDERIPFFESVTMNNFFCFSRMGEK